MGKYWTDETEKAIVDYNSTEELELKNQIFEDKLYYPFFKLTENLIHTFKFYYTEVDNLEDLQHETIVFLLSKIHMFDSTKGFKSFSYFGTAAKRYLINSNAKNYRRKIEKTSIEGVSDENRIVEDVVAKTTNDKLSYYINYWIAYCVKNLDTIFTDPLDRKTADAVLELFKNRYVIDIFNKKALYIYIREMVDGIKTSRITKVVTKLYEKILWPHYTYYLENDILPKEYKGIEPYIPKTREDLDSIKELNQLNNSFFPYTLQKLEADKKNAVEKQDYESAILYQHTIDELKKEKS